MPFVKFDVISLLMNPFVLMFVTIALGLLFGKVKFGKFSFGTSGALFVGLAIGWGVYGFAQKIYESGDAAAAGMKAATQIMEGNGGKVINYRPHNLCCCRRSSGSKRPGCRNKKIWHQVRGARSFDNLHRCRCHICLYCFYQRHQCLCSSRRIYRCHDQLSGPRFCS